MRNYTKFAVKTLLKQITVARVQKIAVFRDYEKCYEQSV